MKIITSLNLWSQVAGYSVEKTLQMLEETYGVKNSYNADYDMYVLNYDQINSSTVKDHPLVMECRSLVVKFVDGEWGVLSRSFDRFFNHGESDKDYDIIGLTAHEKLDGSLVSVFEYDGKWLYRTKSMIMPVTSINGHEATWGGLIESCLDFDKLTSLAHLSWLHNHTFIFELVAPENRIVVRYKTAALRLLSVRGLDGEYEPDWVRDAVALLLDVEVPKYFIFYSWQEAEQACKDLPELEEGFVFYDGEHAPIIKLKNPAYVAAHHLRGEGVLTPKRVCDLIIMNEVDEYLSVFPEDEDGFQPYIEALAQVFYRAQELGDKYLHLESQKDYAMAVKDTLISHIMFSKRKGMTTKAAIHNMSQSAQRDLIINMKNQILLDKES